MKKFLIPICLLLVGCGEVAQEETSTPTEVKEQPKEVAAVENDKQAKATEEEEPTVDEGYDPGDRPSLAQPTMYWISHMTSDEIEKAVLMGPEDHDPEADQLILMDAEQFDPLGFNSLEGDVPEIYSDLYLLLEWPDWWSEDEIEVDVKLTIKVPVCTECDGGCFKLLEERVEEKTYSFIIGGQTRELIDLGELVQDWNLIGLKAEANARSIMKEYPVDMLELKHWAWCM